MTHKNILYVILALLGIVGAGLSVAMIISAVNFGEWGRVVLYCVTLAVCVELAVVGISKLRLANKKD